MRVYLGICTPQHQLLMDHSEALTSERELRREMSELETQNYQLLASKRELSLQVSEMEAHNHGQWEKGLPSRAWPGRPHLPQHKVRRDKPG